jgi:hypothetical protein
MWFIVARIMKIMDTGIVTTEAQSQREATSCIANGADYKRVVSRQAESSDREFWSLIVWRNVIIFLYVHLAAVYGIYLAFTKTKGLTVLWGEYFHSNGVHSPFFYIHLFYMLAYMYMYVWILFPIYIYIHIPRVGAG